MNREQFLDKLFSMYSGSFKIDNKQTWWDAYKSTLNEKVDYEKLYETMLTEYTSKTAPSPAWLKEKAIYKTEYGNNDVIVYENIYATAPNGFVYEFGYNPKESCFAVECENLKKFRGFKDFRKERYEIQK